MQVPAEVQNAFQIALMARSRSHSPYSKFKVGAALKIAGVDEAIGGCNIENASFGATVCAERTALFQAVVSQGRPLPEFLVIVTDEAKATVPCALCLQVLAEFAKDDLPIYLGNLKNGVQKRFLLSELLPYPFRQFTPGAT